MNTLCEIMLYRLNTISIYCSFTSIIIDRLFSCIKWSEIKILFVCVSVFASAGCESGGERDDLSKLFTVSKLEFYWLLYFDNVIFYAAKIRPKIFNNSTGAFIWILIFAIMVRIRAVHLTHHIFSVLKSCLFRNKR